MDAEDTFFKKRLEELANKAYTNGQYLFTGFLSAAELSLYYGMERELSYVPVTVFGGTRDCERVMLRFGDEALCGYEEPFPIACIEISPVVEKFGEELSHRDYLGALMNLGIERGTLGDIIIQGKRAFLFCTEKMAAYIVENMDKVRHTNVRCALAKEVPESTVTRLERTAVQVSAERADGIIAKVYKLSRSECVELFRAKRVFVNGRLNENNSGLLRNGDMVSVRGYGRFQYVGVTRETKKGKLNVEIDLYV
ncbi:MAG: YlmH/Sll1252 family protein [Roseburia sp.]|nr:YlmH/Sll1252 family protein [Roseburia sp.]